MNWELVYDFATTSEAPRSTLGLGSAILVAATLWGIWLKWRSEPLHGGVKFLALMGVVMLAVSVLYRVEQTKLAARTDTITIQGPITGYWASRERKSAGSTSYWQNEGFSVQGVSFSYRKNLEENTFHNAQEIPLRDSMLVRVTYLAEGKQGNRILRLELAKQP